MDSIQDTISLYDPIFQDGTESICVLDQIKDDNVSNHVWSRT